MKKKNKIPSSLNILNRINLVTKVFNQNIKSVIPLFLFLIVLVGQITHINALDNYLTNHDESTLCIIGHLGMCNDDEDCTELPDHQQQQYLNANLSFGQRAGTCLCRDSIHCKRNIQSTEKQPKSDQLSGSDQNSESSSHLRLIIGILFCLTIVGSCSFLIYYYGIRYGMIRHFARRLGLINQNTQVEDNQLLNQIVTNRDEDVDLNI